MIKSPDQDLAKCRSCSGHRQNKKNNKPLAEQELCLTSGGVVNKKNKPLAEQEPRSAPGHAVKIF